MPLYYCINEPADPALQAFTARFDREIDRDNYVSDRPDVRRACDPPADTSGFESSSFGIGFSGKVVGEFKGIKRSEVPEHDLYKDGDPGIPESITDCNGQVVLGLCKRCNRAEVELDEPCLPKGDLEKFARNREAIALLVRGPKDAAIDWQAINLDHKAHVRRVQEAYNTLPPVPSAMNYTDEEITEQRRDLLGLARLAARTSLSREDLAAEARRILGLHGLT